MSNKAPVKTDAAHHGRLAIDGLLAAPHVGGPTMIRRVLDQFATAVGAGALSGPCPEATVPEPPPLPWLCRWFGHDDHPTRCPDCGTQLPQGENK